MIQVKDKFTVEATTMTKSAFGIKEKNMPRLAKFFRSGIYKNKMLAVIREYSTNAYDAHVDNGIKDTPIQVYLPNYLEPVFKVRDFGKGLSEDEVLDIYTSYGESTKSESNDFNGTFGLGSKSAFAYSDSFTVISYHGGMKRTFIAYDEEDGKAVMTKVHECPSDEPTGIEIVVEIKQDDIREWIDNAIKYYVWFTPTPVFFGENILPRIDGNPNAGKLVASNDRISLYKNSYYNQGLENKYNVLMGNVLYPIDSRWVSDQNFESNIPNGYSAVFKANIGEFQFTVSRESIEYLKSTRDTVESYLNDLSIVIRTSVEDKINSCDTPWDVVLLVRNELDSLETQVLSDVVWKGKTIRTRFSNGIVWKRYYSYGKKWELLTGGPKVDKGTVIVVNDGGFPAYQIKARLQAVLENGGYTNSGRNILFAYQPIDTAKELADWPELEGCGGVYKLSEAVGFESNLAGKKGHKQSQKHFVWNGKSQFPYSNSWDSVDVDMNEDIPRVWVTVERFIPHTRKGVRPIWNYLKNMKDALGENMPEIYGLRRGTKMPKNWIELSDWVDNYADKIINDPEFVKAYIDYTLYHELFGYNGSLCTHGLARVVDGFKNNLNSWVVDDQELSNVINRLKDVKYTDTENYSKRNSVLIYIDAKTDWKESLNAEVSKKKRELMESVNKMLDKYTMIDYIDRYASFKNHDMEKLVSYFNSIHSAENS